MNIQKTSRLLQLLSYGVMLVMPVLLVLFWFGIPGVSGGGAQSVGADVGINFIPPSILILHPLSFEDRCIGFLISALPVALLVYLFYTLSKLFHFFRAGEIFSLIVVNVIKRIGYLLLAYEIVDTLFDGLMAVAMTWDNPPGHRYIELTFSGVNGAMMLTAVIVLLVSGIMAEACKLSEEHSLTI